MEEDKKVPQGLPFEVIYGIAHSMKPRAMPTDDAGKKDKDINTSKLKNVTPKKESI